MEIVAETGSKAYVELLTEVIYGGDPISPRGELTFELLNTTVVIKNLEDAHVFNTDRRLNTAILATETMHLIGGLSSLKQLDLASKGRFSQFANRGRLRGAYGPRIRHQLPRVVDLLQRDPDTRQAVISIWTGHEHDDSSRDVPCTLSLQFFNRDGQLHVRSVMRSNDVILGVPYDWWMFSRLGLAVANALNLEPGSLTHCVGSAHLYNRDVALAMEVKSVGVLSEPRISVPPSFVYSGGKEDAVERINLTSAMAGYVCITDEDHRLNDASNCQWYLDRVPRLGEAYELCEPCRYVVPSADMLHGDVCVECAG